MDKEKLKQFIEKVKDFNFTKYLLKRKERNLQTQIEIKDDEIEFFVGQIARDEERITISRSRIVILKDEIKKLETDIKKLIKVINLYID